MVVFGIIGCVVVYTLALMKASAPKSKERELEDAEQLEWIRKWKEGGK